MVVRFAYIELLCLSFALGASAMAQQPQIEHARQIDLLREVRDTQAAPPAVSLPQSESGQDFDSFGVQQMLVCGPERARYCRVFAEVSGFVTNNVGLSHRSPSSDSFLVGNIGLEYRRPLRRNLQVDAGFQVAMFRYNEFGQLNFNSFDVGAGLTYHAEKLGGLDFAARYNFNALQSASSGDTFFKNHTLTAGAEKIFQFNRAHHAVVGVIGRVGSADPVANERYEVGAYAGYHIEVLPRVEVDFGYRYGYYLYTVGARRDHNQTASLGIRYRLTDWFSASASSFYVWDHSNEDVMSYQAGTVGGALMLLLRF